MKPGDLVGIILYSLILIFTIVQLIRFYIYKKINPYNLLQIQFHVLVLFFLIGRIIWLALNNVKNANALLKFILNRFAYLSFFTSFTLLVFFWAEISHGLISGANQTSLKKLKIPFFIANAVLYLYTLICAIVFDFTHSEIEDILI
ncbi:hypothetical protein M0811_11216 [Anaeramoeba ignava]|uniref:THH1/TOM1/TOM3 domain-containing protein n=1 Tax=Anaeramoeba ignava TaxID=1746090 RepID=A0A9Q0LC66_ANAIG|nr:hypothetical protein M0811_11216 [Anaeramoeba ignava]